ncbi:Cytochrome P450 720B2 [Glycine soja]
MESVPTIVYYGGDMISSSERILFEYPSGSQVIRISENISLDALRKTIMDVIQEFSSRGLIELNVTFVLVLLRKSRKLKFAYEIIVMIRDELEEVLRSKPSILALIDELDKLRQPLATALSEELQINDTSSQNPHHQTETENETLAESSGSIEPNSNSRNDVVVEDLLNFLYFGSLFDVKSDFVSTMLTRMHERGCCLTYDYVTDDTTDLLGEKDLDSISALRGLLVSRPADSSFSHKNVLHRCVEHAKLWLAKSEQPIRPDADVTYAALREKLNNIMSSEYFTTTPEMKAPVEVAVAAAGGNYVSFHVPVHGFVVPVEVEQPVFQSQEKCVCNLNVCWVECCWEESLPDDAVADFIINLLFVGNETTTKTMLFAVYFLTQCPRAMKQLLDEHDCFVVSFLSAVHLDENVYSGALNINPWRWMEPENEEKRNWRTSPFYAPFGGGARFCLGAELARL